MKKHNSAEFQSKQTTRSNWNGPEYYPKFPFLVLQTKCIEHASITIKNMEKYYRW